MGIKKKILWIDDDINRYPLMPYVDKFEDNGIEIVKVPCTNIALGILEKKRETDFDCIIIDLSMPISSLNYAESRAGTRTGLVLLKRIIDSGNLRNAKKVIFSIIQDDDIMRYCKENNVAYIYKHDYFPDEFYSKIIDML